MEHDADGPLRVAAPAPVVSRDRDGGRARRRATSSTCPAARARRPRATSTISGPRSWRRRRTGRPTWCWCPPASTPCSAIRSAASPSSPSTTPTSPVACASACPRAPIVGLLEGGYVPARLADGVLAHVLRARLVCTRASSAPPAEEPVTDRLHMEAEYLELRTKHPFIIARGGQSDYRTDLGAAARRRRQRGLGRGGAVAVLRRDGRRRCWRRSTRTRRPCPPIRSTSRRPSAAGSRCSAVNASARAALSVARCTIWSASGSACRSTGCGDSIRPRRRGPPSPSASTRPSGSG